MDYNVITDDVPEGMTALEIASSGHRFGAWMIDLVINIAIIGAIAVIAIVFAGADPFVGVVAGPIGVIA